MFENLSVLIKFEIQAKTTKLRFDVGGLICFKADEQNISEIILRECEITDKLLEDLQECIDQVFEYEIIDENDKNTFQFYGDYGRIENEFYFQSFDEISSEYTKDDLIQKGKNISKLYIDIYEKFEKNNSINYLLRNKLKFELKNDIEKTKRKAEFFEGKDVGKIETLNRQEKILQRLLKILSESREN